AADALLTGLTTLALQDQGTGQQHRDFRLVGERDGIGFGVEDIPEPEKELVPEKLTVGFVGQPGHFAGRHTGYERGRPRVVHPAGLVADLRLKERLTTGPERLKTAVEGLLKERVQAVNGRPRGSADEQLVGLCIPKNGVRLGPQKASVG